MNVRRFIKGLAPLGFGLFAAALWAGDTAISDGQNAENLLGQLNGSEAPVYTQAGPNNGPSAGGFYSPYGVDIDTTTHRLFMSDYTNNRVLIFDLDASDNLVDTTADHVLGQANFSDSLALGVGSNHAGSLKNPAGTLYAPATGLLYVSDSANSRVMVFDVASVTDGENAVNVLGQSSFTGWFGTIGQGRMNFPKGMDYDQSTRRLFVADQSNRRVTVYDVATITNGENAINVLGQPDFTTGTTGTTSSKLGSPVDVAFNPAANALYVADQTNNRVMVFDVAAITDGENAVNVLGQATFTSASATVSISTSPAPTGVGFDGATQRLFVSGSNRVLVFDVATVTDGENAVNVLGQSVFTTSTANTTANGMSAPFFLHISSGSAKLYLPDSNNNRLTVFDVASITDGENAQSVAGQTNLAGTPLFTQKGPNDGPKARGFNSPYDVTIDTAGHRLFAADSANNRVLEFDLDSSNTLTDRVADHVLGQTDFISDGTGLSQNRLNGPRGVEFNPTANQLFVGDAVNSRVLVFDTTAISDGENAVSVLGQSNFTSNGSACSQNSMYEPNGLAFDRFSNDLYVADYNRSRILVYNVASITNGENAISVLGQPDFTTCTSGRTQSKIQLPRYVSLDAVGHRLFVGDYWNSRVLVFDVTTISNGENAVNVLGQADFTSLTNSVTANRMQYPHPEYDSLGNRLFVADSHYARVLVFDVASITDGENAVNVLGAANFTTAVNSASAGGLSGPLGMVFESGMNRLYIADNGNNRIVVHSVGPVAPAASVLSASTSAVTGQIDLSWPSAGDDGEVGNLTGNYRLQYATYTATWSTGSTPTNAVTVTISTVSAPPGGTQSASLSGLSLGTTHYFALWSQDESSNWSGISNIASAYLTDTVAPSSSTLTAVAGTGVGLIDLAWLSAGNEGMLRNLTGVYRIQYATYTATWSTGSTPTNATTLTISTTNVVPGVAVSTSISGLTSGTTYYFALFTGDEVPNWSDISNTTSTIALAPIRSLTIISGNSQAFGMVNMGDQVVGTTGTVVLNDGTLLNTYALRASTLTVGSPWQIMSSTPAGPDQLVFYGVFDGDSAPVLGNFDVDDVIGPENRNSTSGQFSVAGSTTGVSVPAGETRTLWIRLDAPATTTTMAGQAMRIEITAQPP